MVKLVDSSYGSVNSSSLNDSAQSCSTPNSAKRPRVDSSPHVAPRAARSGLPIHSVRCALATELRKHEILVLVGETGCGKSTQVPQYVLEWGIARGGLVAVTQPRRVAAVSLAHRVAAECEQNVGEKVGYSVRFESATSADTELIYATDGVLVREAIHDRKLRRYSVIILDEAHERTVHTEVLFGIVKTAVGLRKGTANPLKVVVMSATMDVEAFSKYFDNAKVAFIEGRTHEVQLRYTTEQQDDFVRSAISAIFQVHRDHPMGRDILVFLTGQQEIESVRRKCHDIIASEQKGQGHGDSENSAASVRTLTLFSAMSPQAQMKAFEPAKVGTRKVILATNIAETSLTIPGVGYVIDCGAHKTRIHMHGVSSLAVHQISQAQAIQRAGRAGREGPGTAYRLYTEREYERMHKLPVPEIARCDLSTVLLELVVMGLKDVAQFQFMTKPAVERIESAVQQLEWLGAVTVQSSSDGSTAILPTRNGRIMAKLPVPPQHAKAVVVASEFGCLDRMLMAVSMCCQQNIFVNTQYIHNAQQATDTQARLHIAEGDHLTYLHLLDAYRRMKNKPLEAKTWCQRNYVHERALQLADKTYTQLRDIALQAGLCAGNNNSDSLIRRALCHGLFTQCARMDPACKGAEYRLISPVKPSASGGSFPGLVDSRARIHPSSALAGNTPSFVVFDELLMLNDKKLYMSNVTVVSEEWLRDALPDGVRMNL